MFPLTNSFIGQNISGYRLERLLGRGGTGMVFLGLRLDNPDDRVAVKILAPAYAISPEDLDALRTRFLREVITLQKLRNPHIVPIRAYGQTFGDDDTNLSYMILPYLEGGTLTQRLARERLPLPTVARYLADLADAVDYAHRQGVIHRDIKPANVLLNGNGAVFLSDFGIARLFEQQEHPLTASGQVMGTPEYMSPEQAAGREVGAQADQYSLGIMVYEMVTGRVPFQGPTIIDYLTQHAQTPPPTPAAIGADLPEPAAAAIIKALSKAPDQRFATSTAFATAFATGLAGEWDPSLVQSDNLTVQKFTPSKTIMVKVDEEEALQGERVTPDKTQAVKLPTEEEIARSKRAKPGLTKEFSEQLLGDARTKGLPVVQQVVTRGATYIQTHRRNSAIGGAVLAALVIFLIVAQIHPPVKHSVVTYSSNPAPGQCDTSPGANWTLTTSGNPTSSCPATGGLVLTDPASSGFLAEDEFSWNAHPFAASYTLNSDITTIVNACVGFLVRQLKGNAQGYGLYVCPNGAEFIERYDATSGTPTQIATIKGKPSPDYRVIVTAKGDTMSMIVNDQQAITAKDGTFTKTDMVSLAIYQFDNTLDASANYVTFTYTAQ